MFRCEHVFEFTEGVSMLVRWLKVRKQLDIMVFLHVSFINYWTYYYFHKSKFHYFDNTLQGITENQYLLLI